MAPKKKSVAPKAGPKAPVGRPRKKLGTRVSDLPTVSTIKPMSRRSNIDSLALQRARLVYKRDYKKTISEDQARAFIDAMGAPKRGPIGERILGPRDDARLRTEFINVVPEEGQKFIQLVKRAKTGFRKDKKDKVSLKVKSDGTVVLHVPGFTDAPVSTSGTLAASAVPEVTAADTAVSDRHARRVQNLLIDLGRLQEALAADPRNPELLQLEYKLQKQVRKERNVLREGYPATASTATSTVYAPSTAASRRTSGRATPIAASEDDIVEAMLPAEPAAPEPAAPAEAPVVPAAVVEAALEAAPELVRQIEAEAPVITVPTGAPRSRRPSTGPVGPAEQADMDTLLARLAELREDPGNARLLEIARLAEEREQRGPQRPPVAVSKSLRRPLTQVPDRLMAEAARYQQELDAERQAAAREAANALLQPQIEDEATRQIVNARIFQRQKEQQEAEIVAARARLDAANREIAARESSRRNQMIANEIVRASAGPRPFGTVYDDIERDPSIPIPGYRRNLRSDQQERARLAQAAAFAILQPGTPVQSESRFATAPSTAAPSGYATPSELTVEERLAEERARQARRHQASAAARLARSFSALEGVSQDLLEMAEAREAISATRALIRQQEEDNERLYREREADKALIAALSEQVQTDLGPPVPVQRNIPSAADPFMQGWASTFPSANIPVPPPLPPPVQPPRPTARLPKKRRDNITMEALADALAKGAKSTQGISTRESIATQREDGPSGLPPSVRSVPSEKELQAAIKRLGKKTTPAVEAGPMDALLVPVSVPSTVNSEMAEKLRQKFEGALKAKFEAARGNKDDEPWDEDVPALVEGALTNIGIDPERAKDEEFAAAMSKKFTGKGLTSKKFLKAVIKHARKTVKGGAMGGRMNDDRTDFRVLMDAMKGLRKGSGFFNGLDSVLNPVHGTPMDNKKDLADAKAAYAARGSGVPTLMTGCGKYTLQAVTFPESDWKSSSSLRWLRSNGIKPIKKADRQGSLFRYRIVDPKGFNDYYTSELTSRGRKINLVYGSQ